MFGFIAFGFKLLFAAITGGALSYIPGEEDKNHKIVETSLICIFFGVLTFFSFINQSFVQLNQINLQILLIVDALVTILLVI